MEIQSTKLLLHVKLNPKEVIVPKGLSSRDMSNKGHFGTGDLELTVKSEDDVELAKQLLEQAYHKVGG